MKHDMKLNALAVVAILVLISVACSLTRPPPEPDTTLPPEEEYYLGWYQGCITAYLMLEMAGGQSVQSVPLCQAFIDYYYERDLYNNRGMPKSWVFPPPAEWREDDFYTDPESTPRPRPTPRPTWTPTPEPTSTPVVPAGSSLS